MTKEEKQAFVRINAFLVNFSMSHSAYENANNALLAQSAQKILSTFS